MICNDNFFYQIFGSGALSGNVLLISIVENNKFDVYFRAG